MQGEGVLVFLFLIGTALIYASLRNALVYCRALVRRGAYSPQELSHRRDTMALVSLLVAGVITGMALAVAPGNGSQIPGYAKLLVFIGTAGVVFSEMLERWALRQCERLADRPVYRRGRPSREGE